MKKLNYIWVFSDSILGHEIQSKALASKIAENSDIYHCAIRQPWLSFAPRILPRFGKNIIWEGKQPDLNLHPDAIITCGRRMAAIGKYYKRRTNCQHIQILNPGDNPKKYDLLICPKHDKIKAPNVIYSTGSLHNISSIALNHIKSKCEKQVLFNPDKKIVSIILGNPSIKFFNQLNELAKNIQQKYPEHDLIICGSRRTPKKYFPLIKQQFRYAQSIWLSENDGKNPYKYLLACSEVLIITADSINMVSEACATNKAVIAIAQDYISPKHKKFIQSIRFRLSDFTNLKANNSPLETLKDVSKQVLLKL